jgi:alpha-tubulin suppressor-like RCC1 family protein
MSRTKKSYLFVVLVIVAQLFVNKAFANSDIQIKKLAVGGYFSVILMENGKLFIKDNNMFSQYDKLGFAVLGDGNDTNWQDIAASQMSIYGIKKDGSMWSAGFNDVGQLGTGNTKTSSKFIQIGKNREWNALW